MYVCTFRELFVLHLTLTHERGEGPMVQVLNCGLKRSKLKLKSQYYSWVRYDSPLSSRL